MAIIKKTDKERLINAIVNAEKKTSGEIRVHIQKRIKDDVYEAAEKKFEKLKMHKTIHRNAVLIYVALKNRAFAVVGDKGIHEKMTEPFWNHVIEEMKEHFLRDNFIEGLEKGIEIVGEALEKHFPHEPGDINELSNEITIDEYTQGY